jgi:hypothetical protein
MINTNELLYSRIMNNAIGYDMNNNNEFKYEFKLAMGYDISNCSADCRLALMLRLD